MRTKPTRAFWSAYSALYGEGNPTPQGIKKKRHHGEDREQMAFNAWFDQFLGSKGCRWFHPPNGGARNAITGSKLRSMGVKKGVPDIIIPMARCGRYGLVIELKRVGGKLSLVSVEQADWLEWFRSQNWSAHVCFGFDEAKKVVEAYFR